jgi:hypothetical protein
MKMALMIAKQMTFHHDANKEKEQLSLAFVVVAKVQVHLS